MPAKVEMPLDEFQAIERARDNAQREVVRLKQELTDRRLNTTIAGTDVSVRNLVELARDLLVVARYAVGQTPVETNKGWPLDALECATNQLMLLPDFSDDDLAIVNAFRDFVAEGRRTERFRAERDS